LVSWAAQPRDFVLQEGGGDEQAQLDGQALQRVLQDGEQLVPVQGQLDPATGLWSPGVRAGRRPLASGLPIRIGSFQGGSSSGRYGHVQSRDQTRGTASFTFQLRPGQPQADGPPGSCT